MTQALYLLAGMILPVFYLPQILHCIRDNTKLQAFSLSKSICQLLLRLAMLPFLWHVDNFVIIAIAMFDFIGRLTEFSFALHALRRQKCSWSSIGQRLSPVRPVLSFANWFKPSADSVPHPEKKRFNVPLEK